MALSSYSGVITNNTLLTNVPIYTINRVTSLVKSYVELSAWKGGQRTLRFWKKMRLVVDINLGSVRASKWKKI